jgi:hypothetical protein
VNLDTSSALRTVESAETLTDDDLLASIDGPDLVSDDEIDYAGITRRTRPDQPGGKIVFDSADYATDEEAMVAFEALLLHDLMGPDDEAASTP